jgi:hypothetical protein
MFPFFWIGVSTAALFLLAVLAIFGVLAKLLDVAELGIRGSVVPGLVSGFRGGAADPGSRLPRSVSPGSPDGGDGDVAGRAVVTHRLHPRVR